jgi:Zinc carboxypeptidase
VGTRPSPAVLWCAATLTLVAAACGSGATARSGGATPSRGPSIVSTDVPTTVAVTLGSTTPTSAATSSTTAPAMTTSVPSRAVDPAVLSDISMTSVPPDVIVPTSEATLNKTANPINGGRGGPRPEERLECVTRSSDACLAVTLDRLGFHVTGGSAEDQARRAARATAVVQLDAGLPVTGTADEALLRYLGMATETAGADAPAAEVRQIGTSAQGRPILALRYGDGPKAVLVVGQTHGDEEGGLRVLQRVRSLSLPEGVTMWVVPTLNPDGLALDTRFLANGADPNRRAPGQPEQQAVHDLALAIRPSLTVWYHQNYGWVGGSGASMEPARQYQAVTGLGSLRRSGDCAVGFMWCPIDQALGISSILVELPDVLTPAEVHAHALALLAVSADAP